MSEQDTALLEEDIAAQLPDYASEVAGIISGGMAPGPLKEKLLDYHENDIAAALALLNPEARRKLYGVVSTQALADILEYADNPDKYLDELPLRKRVEILSQMEIPAAVEYLSGLEKSERNNLIDLLDDETRAEVTMALSFDEDEIGSRMSTNYVAIHAGLSVRQAMRELIDQAAENDNISTM